MGVKEASSVCETGSGACAAAGANGSCGYMMVSSFSVGCVYLCQVKVITGYLKSMVQKVGVITSLSSIRGQICYWTCSDGLGVALHRWPNNLLGVIIPLPLLSLWYTHLVFQSHPVQ